jgi:hypothetical protein
VGSTYAQQSKRKNIFYIEEKMKPEAIKDVLYGGIAELLRNPAFCRRSEVEAKYTAWTAEGQAALHEFVAAMIVEIDRSEKIRLTEEAKKQTLSTLKN